MILGPVSWGGGSQPAASFSLAVPSLPALAGVTLYLQGALVNVAGGPSLGLTNGLAVTVAAAVPYPGLVAIEPGTFQMGSDAEGQFYGPGDNTKPAHPVTISQPYWIGRFEVTQAEYTALMGTNPAFGVGPTRPVNNVTWFDAVAYCDALNAQQSALGNVPAGYQFRLPTDAEWEYACRAGTTTEFAFGPGIFCSQARFWDSNYSVPRVDCYENPSNVPVGSYAPNAWGLYDMHGNVGEWTLDSFSDYTDSPKTDPFVQGGPNRIRRGGGFFFSASSARSARRAVHAPTLKDWDIGFRIVLGPALTF